MIPVQTTIESLVVSEPLYKKDYTYLQYKYETVCGLSFTLIGEVTSNHPKVNKKEVEGLVPGASVGIFYEIIQERVRILELKILTEQEDKKMVDKTETTKTENKYFTIKGTIFYAHVKDRDTKGEYPSNAYTLDLSVSDKTVEALTRLGVKVNNKGDAKGNFVRMKSKNTQPKIILPDGEDVTGKILVGNGSTAEISTSLYDNSETNVKAGKGGRKLLGLGTIKLITLEEYESRPLVDE